MLFLNKSMMSFRLKINCDECCKCKRLSVLSLQFEMLRCYTWWIIYAGIDFMKTEKLLPHFPKIVLRLFRRLFQLLRVCNVRRVTWTTLELNFNVFVHIWMDIDYRTVMSCAINQITLFVHFISRQTLNQQMKCWCGLIVGDEVQTAEISTLILLQFVSDSKVHRKSIRTLPPHIARKFHLLMLMTQCTLVPIHP